MTQSNKAQAVAIAIIAVVSILLVSAVAYLFFQVNNLQEENKSLRHKWQTLHVLHECIERKTAKQNEKIRCGVKGDRGKKGDSGYDGIGIPGKDGMKGEKGDPGICNSSCGQNLSVENKTDSPLIHMVGDGKQNKRIDNLEESAVSFWNVTCKAGDISYSKAEGKLSINVKGFYYIYSQMAYCGKKERNVGHTMSINGKNVLKSTVTAKVLGTHRVGGIFKLRKGDKIAISPVVTNLEYCFSRQEAYFGAVLVRK
ncbi:collagen alpha-1(X) chain-like isoform X2 [Paramuricea clavata]|uniref:Collagen alpha-1(X) chain-like isoform X2 n=1 Tax=Paramuricea clavata TaxID=317549 RepID=A0A7D9HK27_PARCT|nr:collagen alpha-1(X) chain-like isoform X2 [Paramuricea clavata]